MKIGEAPEKQKKQKAGSVEREVRRQLEVNSKNRPSNFYEGEKTDEKV